MCLINLFHLFNRHSIQLSSALWFNIDVFKEISNDHVINFDPRNELDLISQLEDNLFNESKLNEISLKAFKNSENFTWEKSALNTIEVYNKLI